MPEPASLPNVSQHDASSEPTPRAPGRVHFHQELERLQSEVLVLGSMVEKATLRAVEALRNRDMPAARAIDADDALVNRKRFEIEQATLLLLATQQPMASDLRRLAAILFITTDLERIGDYAAGNARVCVRIGDEPLIKPLIDIPRMAELAASMLRRSLEAFVQQDIAAAESIAREDDEVDALYEQVYRELLLIMIANPKAIDQATHLLWVAHNLERVADRVQNICERVVYVATGQVREFSRTHGY